jgi:hypothetical protein
MGRDMLEKLALLGRQNYYDGNDCERLSERSKYNDFNKKITKKEMSEITEKKNIKSLKGVI